MSFHLKKCMALNVTYQQKRKQTSYQLHGHATENVTTTKYLGVNIQDCMRWATHINTITNKANKTLGFLRRNLKPRQQKDKGNFLH